MQIIKLNELYYLYENEDFVCPYYRDGRINTVEIAFPLQEKAVTAYSRLLQLGYRRVSGTFYKNTCRTCCECIPIRLEANLFRPSKSQRRALSANRDIKITVGFSEITPEKVKLYSDYVRGIHSHDEEDSLETELGHIHKGYPGTIEMDYYLEDRLAGVGILDMSEDSLSSVYFYHDPAIRDRRPGVFSILQEIELCRDLSKKYYYLGYYIKNIPKMAYKNEFRPYELFRNGVWTAD